MRIQIFQLLLKNLTKGDSNWLAYTLPCPTYLLYSFTSPIHLHLSMSYKNLTLPFLL